MWNIHAFMKIQICTPSTKKYYEKVSHLPENKILFDNISNCFIAPHIPV